MLELPVYSYVKKKYSYFEMSHPLAMMSLMA